MFNRILVPINGSALTTEALRVSERLADRWNCELHALSLVEWTQIESGVANIIERQVAAIGRRPKVDVRRVSHNIAEDIAGEFDRVDDTLIVMGTWGRGRSAGLVPNYAERVLRLVRSPMIMLGPEVEIGAGWPDGPLLIATDGSPFSTDIVRAAAEVASAMAIEPKLVTIVPKAPTRSEQSQTAGSAELDHMAQIVESVAGKPVSAELLHGHHPERTIVEYARRHRPSLIAMSTHGRSGVSRLALDSVSMGVVRRAPCPVLLNHPLVTDT